MAIVSLNVVFKYIGLGETVFPLSQAYSYLRLMTNKVLVYTHSASRNLELQHRPAWLTEGSPDACGVLCLLTSRSPGLGPAVWEYRHASFCTQHLVAGSS